MQHVITPYSSGFPPFSLWNDGFSDQELNFLQNQAAGSKRQAQVGGNPDQEQLKKIRRSQVSWIEKNNDTSWIFQKLSHIVSVLNNETYRFDLVGFGEEIQLTHYDESYEGMYGWHVDYGGNNSPSRKLSLVLQLSDPSEYEGGNLELNSDGRTVVVPKRRGLLAAFPSYVLHQVTPVTKGNRQSLVAWISGPPFR